MAEVKVSALTALTGANVANGDELYIVDTGSPNVSKKITADELAQMPQLSSRYQPQTNDRLFVPAGAFGVTQGSPSLSLLDPSLTTTRQAPYLFDDSSVEAIAAWAYVPPWWQTFNIKLWWVNSTANAGDVRWQVPINSLQDGDTIGLATTGIYADTVTAAGQFVVKVTTLFTGVTVVANEALAIQVIRIATHAGDTLTGDVGVFGVSLERAS